MNKVILKNYIMLALNWLWPYEIDRELICNEIYDNVRLNRYLNKSYREKGYIAIDDVQIAVRDELKQKILS